MTFLKVAIFVFAIHSIAAGQGFDTDPGCDPASDPGCENNSASSSSSVTQASRPPRLSPEFDIEAAGKTRFEEQTPHPGGGSPTRGLLEEQERSFVEEPSSVRLARDAERVGAARQNRNPGRKSRKRGRKNKKGGKKPTNTMPEAGIRPTNASMDEAVSTSEPYCPDCGLLPCFKTDLNNCPGGLTYGYCNCCQQCAKVEGEECGGVHDHFGKCDNGLECTVEATRPVPNVRVVTTRNTPEDHRGTCTRVAPPEPKPCKPECTPEYCLRNRKRKKAICSARSQSLEHRSCQGDCQHTTCGACFFQKAPDCKDRCDLDDFQCIKKFAKCARKKIYAKPKKMRGRMKATWPLEVCNRLLEAVNGRFVCWVPECKKTG